VNVTRDKSAKFIELANKRVNKAIKDIKLVANLANKQNYEYSEDQARKIVKALQHEIDLVKQSFVTGDEDNQVLFRL
jgi:mitochondrial fission protein ELM1